MRGLGRRGVLAGLAGLPFGSAGQAGVVSARMPRPSRAVPPEPAVRLVALSVGVNAYRHLDPLTRAATDARAMQARLAGFGYAGEPCLDPDRKALDAAIDSFVGQLGPDASAILFYAGHGFQAGGSNYLTSIETSGDRETLFPSSVALGPLLERVAAKKPRQTVVILDACREFPWLKGGDDERKGFSSILAPSGFYIVYSAGSGELALDDLGDGDKNPNSIFTRTFLKELTADTSVDMAVKSTRAQVTCLAASVSHPQHPAIYDQTTEELTLAGRVVRTRQTPPGAGELPRTLAVVIAQEGMNLHRLEGPPHDRQMIETAFRSLGCPVTSALNPARATVERMLDEAGRTPGIDQVVLYWSGNGCYVENTDGVDAVFMISIDDQLQACVGISLAEILRRLDAQHRRVVVLGDICLDRQPRSIFAGAGPGDTSALGVLIRSPETVKRETLGDCAGLFATSFGAISQDTVDGAVHSPFAGAVANALGRPGISLRDFAGVIRNEVDDMTDGSQLPALFGVRQATTSVFVQARGCIAVGGAPSSA